MARPPRAFCLQSVHAHTEPVNAASLGPSSARVLVTGGDDCLVNVWRLGKKTPKLRLVGHQTEVDSVRFNAAEDAVAAGSRGGTVKLWDLAAAGKAARTLAGHRASVRCLAFHPFGEYLASGSMDANLKLWDARKRECVQTFRGHSAAVTDLTFTPDGRWVVSGDAAGGVHVWDLAAGRAIKALRVPAANGAAVTSIACHPCEFVMAVGSAGRNAALWELEHFELVAQTGYEPQAVDRVLFSPDNGEQVLSAGADSMRVWAWEPVALEDHVETTWGRLADMAWSPTNELVGVSHHLNVVSVHVVDLARVAPFGEGGEEDGEEAAAGAARGAGAATAAAERRGGPSSPERAPAPSPSPAPAPRPAPASEERPHIFATPINEKFVNAHRGGTEPGSPGIDVVAPERPPQQQQQQQEQQQEQPQQQERRRQALGSMGASMKELQDELGQRPACMSPPAAVRTSFTPASPSVAAHPTSVLRSPSGGVVHPAAAAAAAPAPHAAAAAAAAPAPTPAPAPAPAPAPDTRPALDQTFIGAGQLNRGAPIGLDPSRFAPERVSEQEVQRELAEGHHTMASILTQRLSNARLLRSFWSRGDTRGLVRALAQMDAASQYDFLSAAEDRTRELLTLELSRDLMPALHALMSSQFEDYVSTSLRYVTMVLDAFGRLIKDSRTAAAIGPDVQQEERLQRCNDCFNSVRAMERIAVPIADRASPLGAEARAVVARMRDVLYD